MCPSGPPNPSFLNFIISISVDGVEIRSNTYINILGLTFDSKMQRNIHITNAIKTANGVLNAIKLIKMCFTYSDLVNLVTSKDNAIKEMHKGGTKCKL